MSVRVISSPLRIVLVEDNPADVLWFRITLDGIGIRYELVHRDDAHGALSALLMTTPDIVFVDLNLPGMSGEDLLERLRDAIAGGLPVCILTGSTLEQKRLPQRFGLDAKCYIVKPISQDSFIDALSCFESTRPLVESLRKPNQPPPKSTRVP